MSCSVIRPLPTPRRPFWYGALFGTLLCLCGALSAGPARAWNATGHRLIAALAWDELDAGQRRTVEHLLAAHPALPHWQAAARSRAARDLFIESATWPDTVRRHPQPPPGADDAARELGARRTWHYVNIPLDDWQAGPRGGALHRALPHLIRRLGEDRQPAAERADALVWLAHLVGDAHQPLHVVSRFADGGRGRHDAGGNRFVVRLPSGQRGESNLHRVWDNLPGASGLRGGRLDRRAARLAARGPAVTAAGEVADWLAESHALAGAGVYPAGTPPVTLSPEYLAWAQARADAQLVHAARRLAAVLGSALASGPAAR